MSIKYLKTIFFVIVTIFFNILLQNIFANSKDFVKILAPSAVVIDVDTNRVLFEKNANKQMPMASLTKLMTSILLVENCKMDELIEVPKDAVWIGGSEVGLKKGDKVSAKSLLYGMLLPSGNDCAYTVGYHIGGSIENFANMMNSKAKELGLTNTFFVNPHGLDNPNHYTTAKEMALIANYALKNKYIAEISKTKTATINFGSFSKFLANTNALLSTYPLAEGGKTGFTNGANRCLVASAKDGEKKYICVILGADTTNIRFGDARKLLDECFKNYTKTDISKYLNFYINIPVEKGNIDYYERTFKDTMNIPLQTGEYADIHISQNIVENIIPPIQAGANIGKIEVFIQDEKIYEKNIILEENIYKKNMINYIVDSLTNIFKEKSII